MWVKAKLSGGPGVQAVPGEESKKKRKRPQQPPGAPGEYPDPDKDSLFLQSISSSPYKRVRVFTYPGKGAFLDVREMFAKKDSAHPLPSKKGITLTLPQAEALFACGPEILAAMRAVPPEAKGSSGEADAEAGEEEEEEEG